MYDNFKTYPLDISMNHHSCKLDEIQIRTILSIPKDKLTNIQIAKYFNVNRTSIYSIRNGRNWKHI